MLEMRILFPLWSAFCLYRQFFSLIKYLALLRLDCTHRAIPTIGLRCGQPSYIKHSVYHNVYYTSHYTLFRCPLRLFVYGERGTFRCKRTSSGRERAISGGTKQPAVNWLSIWRVQGAMCVIHNVYLETLRTSEALVNAHGRLVRHLVAESIL